MLETAVDRLHRPVAATEAVEERQDLDSTLLQDAAEASQLNEQRRDTTGQGVDDGPPDELPPAPGQVPGRR